MQLLVLFTTAALLSACHCSNVNRHLRILHDMDNTIEPTVITKQKNKLRLIQWPPAVLELKSGTSAELTCEALGKPAPSVHWYRNDEPVYEHETESHEVTRHPATATIGRVVSKLVVTRANDGDHYTCLVTSLSLTARATTTIYNNDGGVTSFTERTRLAPLAPRIVFYYRVIMEAIDKDIILPCRAKGHPKPHFSWLDINGTVIENHPRMRVLRSGDLVISRPRWTDMGGYTCKATNVFGADSVSIFLYPAKAS